MKFLDYECDGTKFAAGLQADRTRSDEWIAEQMFDLFANEAELKSLMWRRDLSRLPLLNPVDVLVLREDLNDLMNAGGPLPQRVG